MLDFGWTELILIMALGVLVIGPKEIPGMMRGLGQIVRRLQYMRYAVSQQFDDFMKEADMNDIGRGVNFEAGRVQDDADFNEAEADEDFAFVEPEKTEKGEANEQSNNAKS